MYAFFTLSNLKYITAGQCKFLNALPLQDMEDGKDMEGDERSVAHLLKDQIEFADVILLNKTDLVSKKQLKLLKGMLKGWNATAEVIATKESKVCDLYC